MRPAGELIAPIVYDSLDEALMETFPASDPIAVDVVPPANQEGWGPQGNEPANTDQVPAPLDDWHGLLLRSRASISLAPRRRPVDRLAS
jgi:hypothetical protein